MRRRLRDRRHGRERLEVEWAVVVDGERCRHRSRRPRDYDQVGPLSTQGVEASDLPDKGRGSVDQNIGKTIRRKTPDKTGGSPQETLLIGYVLVFALIPLSQFGFGWTIKVMTPEA